MIKFNNKSCKWAKYKVKDNMKEKKKENSAWAVCQQECTLRNNEQIVMITEKKLYALSDIA